MFLPFALLLSSIASFGQEQQPLPTTNQKEDATEIACPMSTNMVILEVQVKTLTGLPVVALTHTDFVVFEDKVKQQIAFFIAEESGSGVYKIGYYPTNLALDGEPRKIRVKVVNGK